MAGDTSFEADLQLAAADLDRLVRRLRSLSQAAWRSRREPVQAALAALVALNEEVVGRPLGVPKPANHVLADAIAVVGAEVLDCSERAPEVLQSFMTVIDAALQETR